MRLKGKIRGKISESRVRLFQRLKFRRTSTETPLQWRIWRRWLPGFSPFDQAQDARGTRRVGPRTGKGGRKSTSLPASLPPRLCGAFRFPSTLLLQLGTAPINTSVRPTPSLHCWPSRNSWCRIRILGRRRPPHGLDSLSYRQEVSSLSVTIWFPIFPHTLQRR